MGSFKKLSKADVTTVDYSANKRWSFSYDGDPTGSIKYYAGNNISFKSPTDYTINGQYASLIYAQTNHLFYQAYTSSLNTGSIMFNIETYESASSQRPTSSYFNYNTNPLLIKSFPTGVNEAITVISINQDIYGSKVLPGSFKFSSSVYLIIDDNNGNLYDIANYEDDYIDLNYISSSYFDNISPGAGKTFVGNIFYAHGELVITNQDYIAPLFSYPYTISFQNEHTIYENEVRCIVRESDFNLSYNPTLLKYGGQYITSGSSGYTLTGSFDSTVKDFATGSAFQPYVTTIGLYNDNDELLMVAKLGKPIMLSPDTDTTFIVRYDT